MTVNCKECEELKSILRSIIDILCEYSLIHTDMPINHLKTDVSKIHAMTLDDKRIIYICRDQGHYSKRISVLHELKHAEHFIGSDYDEFQRKSNKEFEKQINDHIDEINNIQIKINNLYKKAYDKLLEL